MGAPLTVGLVAPDRVRLVRQAKGVQEHEHAAIVSVLTARSRRGNP
jgi:hypothetical protein